MTYFGFLLLFVGLPLLALAGAYWLDGKRGRRLPEALGHFPPLAAVLLHVAIAVIYTTPWDNYLVATAVWWYDPSLVTGITLGWVPIEEYTFFVVQTLLAGLWLLFLARRLPVRPDLRASSALRVGSTALLALPWLISVLILATGWEPGTYLALELAWALPPIGLQLLFGADILWQQRRLVFLTIAPLTVYLAAADSLAIGSGTWTINPDQSLGVLLGGVLPIEEFVFFLLTNTLVAFGITLVLSAASADRARTLGAWWRSARSKDLRSDSAPQATSTARSAPQERTTP